MPSLPLAGDALDPKVFPTSHNEDNPCFERHFQAIVHENADGSLLIDSNEINIAY